MSYRIDHTYNYSSTGVYVCYNTFCTGTHQYISGWNTDVQTGTSTLIYSLGSGSCFLFWRKIILWKSCMG